MPLPLTLLSTLDPVLRDTAVFSMLTDSPGMAAVRHEMVDIAGKGSGIRRLVLDATGVVEDVLLPPESGCLTCAAHEDAVSSLRRLADLGRWTSWALALPVSGELMPACFALSQQMERGHPLDDLRLASAIFLADVAQVESDLLNDDLLDDRGLALGIADRRSVGQALAASLGHADVVVTAGDPVVWPVGSDLVDHLRASDSARVDGLFALSTAQLLEGSHDCAAAADRLDPRCVQPNRGSTENGVWSLDLSSDRPFHPDRLLEHIERLGAGRMRSRGRFWIPVRPDTACAWDGVGGQLSIGNLGPWDGCQPSTRIVYTGMSDERPRLVEAFEELLLTPSEMKQGLDPWLGRDHVLSPWIGE